MVKRSGSNDGDASQETLHDVKRDRARLRIAYIRLYQQYLDLDTNHNNDHESTMDEP